MRIVAGPRFAHAWYGSNGISASRRCRRCRARVAIGPAGTGRFDQRAGPDGPVRRLDRLLAGVHPHRVDLDPAGQVRRLGAQHDRPALDRGMPRTASIRGSALVQRGTTGSSSRISSPGRTRGYLIRWCQRSAPDLRPARSLRPPLPTAAPAARVSPVRRRLGPSTVTAPSSGYPVRTRSPISPASSVSASAYWCSCTPSASAVADVGGEAGQRPRHVGRAAGHLEPGRPQAGRRRGGWPRRVQRRAAAPLVQGVGVEEARPSRGRRGGDHVEQRPLGQVGVAGSPVASSSRQREHHRADPGAGLGVGAVGRQLEVVAERLARRAARPCRRSGRCAGRPCAPTGGSTASSRSRSPVSTATSTAPRAR